MFNNVIKILTFKCFELFKVNFGSINPCLIELSCGKINVKFSSNT